MLTTVHMWSSEDNTQESLLSSHHTGLRDQTQLLRLTSKCPLSHLTDSKLLTPDRSHMCLFFPAVHIKSTPSDSVHISAIRNRIFWRKQYSLVCLNVWGLKVKGQQGPGKGHFPPLPSALSPYISWKLTHFTVFWGFLYISSFLTTINK